MRPGRSAARTSTSDSACIVAVTCAWGERSPFFQLVAVAGPGVLEDHGADVQPGMDRGRHAGASVEGVRQRQAGCVGTVVVQEVDPERADGDDEGLPAARRFGGRTGPDTGGATSPQTAPFSSARSGCCRRQRCAP